MTVERRVLAVNHDLHAAKKALAKDLAALEARNRELKERLLSEGLTLSKAMTVVSNQLAEARREDALQSFKFWVSFHDGTTEKSIDELIEAIHGRRGQAKAGWQNVEVNLPRPQTPDGLFDALKKVKIVRAVAVNPTSVP